MPRLAFELAPHSITQLAYDYYSLYVDESIVASIVFIVDELNHYLESITFLDVYLIFSLSQN